ncbi:MAG: hypothetical protein ACREEM_23450 [Blastocatellia bacterium]
MRIILSITLLLALSLSALLAVRSMQSGAAQTEQVRVPMKTSGVALQLTFGLKDAQAADWGGSLKISTGRLERLEGRLLANDQIEGGAWRLRSRLQGQGANARVNPARLFAVFDAPPDAKVEVTTGGRSFSFTLGEVGYDKRMLFLDSAVAVERVPQFAQVTRDASEDDFPACAAAPDGAVWCAYVAYKHGTPIDRDVVNQGKFDTLVTKGNGDQIRLLKFDGQQWSGAWDVTESGLDVWRPAVAVDAQGGVHVVWSQNVNGAWDLRAASFDPKAARFSAARRLTTGAGADINPVAVATRDAVWVAWQGWRGGNFDIWLAKLASGGLQNEQRVSTSAANDWHPAIAANSAGDVWIAWDSYDQGNYDVLARLLSRGKLSEPIAVAASPRFEARPSLAVDAQNRAWIAFEDAGANWGKDYGSRWEGKSGVAFYITRTIKARCLANGGASSIQQTKDDVKALAVDTDMLDGTPARGRDKRLSFPRLGVDDEGRVWLLFRRHPAVNGQGERWVSYATYFDGSRWSEEITLPRSENLMDNRPALARLRGGAVLALYSTDSRTAGTNTAGENNLIAAALKAGGGTAAPSLVPVNPKGDGGAVEPVHPNEKEDLRRIRDYRATVGGKTYQLLRGEFHRHTEISAHRDQDGPFEEIWRYGLDTAAMDWIGPGDHDNGVGPQGMTHEYTWWLSQKQIDIYHHAPTFMPMFTYERSVVYPSGHRNVMFTKRGIRPLPRMGATQQQRDLMFGAAESGAPDVKNLYAYLRFFDGICSVHTSATNMGTDWRDNDPKVEPVVEIYQGHRQNYEEPGAPMAAKNAQDSIGGYEPAGYVWNAFAKGHRLGFQISSDHVSTHISYGIVYAERPTREAILDAFKRRHSYAAHDNIILDVRCGRQMMGDEFTLKTQPKLEISVAGTAPVARVEIVRQIDREKPAYVYLTEPKQQNVKLTWADNQAKAGAVNMYYVRIQQSDGKMAWASPVWITYQP